VDLDVAHEVKDEDVFTRLEKLLPHEVGVVSLGVWFNGWMSAACKLVRVTISGIAISATE
jgi:hypothetical protein